ncbi:MAG: hypothetical protein ACPGUE_14710 [Marinomonas sp.]
MNFVVMAVFNVLKSILLKMASEKFLYWLLFWVGDIVVKSTKTPKDDEFLAKLKQITEEDK